MGCNLAQHIDSASSAEVHGSVMMEDVEKCDKLSGGIPKLEPTVISPIAADSTMRDTPAATDSSNPKSILIHCIIERRTNETQELLRSENSVRMSGGDGRGGAERTVVERDTFVKIPASTLFHDIIRACLRAIGYAEPSILGAEGSIEIKNWKPMTLGMITDDELSTVQEILRDVVSLITLRIHLHNSAMHHIVTDVKQKMLSFLLQHSRDLLVTSGCPIQQKHLMQISNDSLEQYLSDDARTTFNKWYQEQMPCMQQQQQLSAPTIPTNTISLKINSNHNSLSPNLQESESSSSPTSGKGHDSNTTGTRTHVRTWFDPDSELPLLQEWLVENKHPTRADMTKYLDELNAREYRCTHRPLDLSNLTYWFKNARARFSVHKTSESNWGLKGKPVGADHKGTDCLGDNRDSRFLFAKEDVAVDRIGSDHSRNSSAELVPELPNRNAVYVINPMIEQVGLVVDDAAYHNQSDSCCSSSIDSDEEFPLECSNGISVKLKRKGTVESDENHNERGATILSHNERSNSLSAWSTLQDQATDLSVRSSAKDNQSNVTDDRTRSVENRTSARDSRSWGGPHSPSWTLNPGRELKRSRDRNSDSDSDNNSHPLPRQNPAVASSNVLPQFALPPHLHALQQQHAALQQQQQQVLHQQHALRMAAMSHAMRFMHPSNGAYALQQRGMFHPSAAPSLPTPPQQQAVTPQPYDDDNTHDSSGSNNGDSDRKKRSRVFIDPLSEIPKLEQWFLSDSHPSSFVIEQFTNELNRATYRQRFPPLEPKNVQLWFKNHRAKVKRQRLDFAQTPKSGEVECAPGIMDSYGSYDAKASARWDARIVVKSELLNTELPSHV